MTTEVQPYTLADARFYANRLMRYMSRALFVIEPIERPGIGTFAVDKYWRMYYDPDCFERWTLDELAGVVLHECLHLVLNHSERREAIAPNPTEEDLSLWNQAADLAINSVLMLNQIKLPADGIFPGQGEYTEFEVGLSTEQYFSQLTNRRLRTSEPPPQSGTGLPAGSGSDGVDKSWEDPAPAEGKGLTTSDQKRVRRSTVQEIKEQQRSGRGTGSNELSVIIETILEPKVNPVTELYALVKYAINSINGVGSTTYKKINRRHHGSDLRIPAHIQPIPQVRIIIDSSGSMGETDDLPLAAGVVAKVVNGFPNDGIEVYCADTEVRSCNKIFNVRELVVTGRGGTNMDIAIDHIDEQRPRPDVILVVTDGGTEWPSKETRAKCIACLTQPASAWGEPPSWVTTIEVFETS